MRSLLASSGWLLMVPLLYGSVVALEYYWNVYDWQPRYDLVAAAILAATLASLVTLWFLAKAVRGGIAGAVSLILALCLFALGWYVLLPEPSTSGLFQRDSPSPWWYRGARLLVLSLPLSFWFLFKARLRSRSG